MRKPEQRQAHANNSVNVKYSFNQIVVNALFKDKLWISDDDKLYYWAGTHYEHFEKELAIKKISDFANAYPDYNRKGELTYPYAKPSCVREALRWVNLIFGVDPDLVNPPGLNCTNGVLRFSWEQFDWKSLKPNWELIPHNPALYYTYEPLQEADSSLCDHLVETMTINDFRESHWHRLLAGWQT